MLHLNQSVLHNLGKKLTRLTTHPQGPTQSRQHVVGHFRDEFYSSDDSTNGVNNVGRKHQASMSPGPQHHVTIQYAGNVVIKINRLTCSPSYYQSWWTTADAGRRASDKAAVSQSVLADRRLPSVTMMPWFCVVRCLPSTSPAVTLLSSATDRVKLYHLQCESKFLHRNPRFAEIFPKVGSNWIKSCSLVHIRTCNRCVRIWLKILSHLGEWVSRGLTSYSTQRPTRHYIGHFGDDFYRPDDTTNSVKALKEASWPPR